MAFANTHLSFSRLSRFEQCALSFRFQYIDRMRAEAGMPLRFGKVIHETCEHLLAQVIEGEQVGPLDEGRALSLFSEAWAREGLVGSEEFREGLAIVRTFVQSQGIVDHRDVLAVEKEFRLSIGRFTVIGSIDRIDRVDDETIEVVDYKTNRALFTRDEVESSLQLSLYEIAARRLWPWVKNVKLSYVMLRHGAIRMSTSRTAEQLEAAAKYIETLGEMTESATEFPARLGPNCVYCDHRTHCSAYAEALRTKRPELGIDPTDLEVVAREREQVATLAKILYARKSELENVLREHLKERDELVLAGTRYSLIPTTSVSYPLGPTLDVLELQTGIPRQQLVEQIAIVDKDALDKVIRRSTKELDRSRAHLFKQEVEAIAERTVSPRFVAKGVR